VFGEEGGGEQLSRLTSQQVESDTQVLTFFSHLLVDKIPVLVQVPMPTITLEKFI